MKTHDGDIKGFHHLSRSWYGEACLSRSREGLSDEITFGFYSPEGGSSGEMTMVFESLGGEIVPCLNVYNDAWHTLNEFHDVLSEMAEVDDQNITPLQFSEILLKCGFTDRTAVQEK